MDIDNRSVRSGNYHTLTLTTPVAISKEPTDYNILDNKPSINGVVLEGDKTWEDFGLPDLSTLPDFTKLPTTPLSEDDLNEILEIADEDTPQALSNDDLDELLGN